MERGKEREREGGRGEGRRGEGREGEKEAKVKKRGKEKES